MNAPRSPSQPRSRLLDGLQLVLIGAGLVLLVLAVRPGAAAPFGIGTGTPADQQRVEAALATIDYDVENRLAGWTVTVSPPRPGVAGYTWTQTQTIELFADEAWSQTYLTRVLAHEIGHAIDVTWNDAEDRQRWLEARGVPDADWWPSEDGATDFATGAGDFAEVFALTVSESDFRSQLAGPPTADQLVLLDELVSG